MQEHLALGGRLNTKVFHGWAKARKMKNKMYSLVDSMGVERIEEVAKGDNAVEYFTNLLWSSNPMEAT